MALIFFKTFYSVTTRKNTFCLTFRVIVVTPTAIKLLDPFVRDTIDGRFSSIPLWAPERIPGTLQSRIKNLHRLPFRIVINKRVPTVIATESGVYIGQDGAFAAVLAAKMNATPVYISDPSLNGKIYYGYKQTSNRTYGTFAGVVDGYADVSVNGHFLKDYNCYSAELTRHVRWLQYLYTKMTNVIFFGKK